MYHRGALQRGYKAVVEMLGKRKLQPFISLFKERMNRRSDLFRGKKKRKENSK